MTLMIDGLQDIWPFPSGHARRFRYCARHGVRMLEDIGQKYAIVAKNRLLVGFSDVAEIA